MDQNLEKNNDLELEDQEAIVSDNYSVDSDEDYREPYVEKATHRHVKLWAFLILAIFIVLMIGWRFYGNFFKPLEIENEEWLVEQVDSNQNNTRSIEELRNSDTDQDGLTDYQELYQYYTSMFLPDSDSDGITDAEEVSAGEDPLCPVGESCNLLRLITPNTKLSSVVNDISLDPNLTIQQAAVAEFRKLLAEGGMTEEELALLTDEDLITIFQAVDDSNILDQGQLNASTTPAEIREFLLVLPGTDPDEINSMTDEELLELAEKVFSPSIE